MAHELFLHGVASGDPLTDRIVLWTHVAGLTEGTARVTWRIARDPGLQDVVASGTALAEAVHDHTVHVDAAGLEPATTYWFGFETYGQHSPVGRTRTLPAGAVASARFAVVSCAKFNAGHFNAYDRIADRALAGDLDLLLHLGDYIYEASQTPPANQTPGADIGRPFEPRHECVTLDDYRTRYRQYHRDPSVQRLGASIPMVAGMDDHELADGAWAGGADNHDEATMGPWADRFAAALRAREEWLPIRRPDPADPTRVYRSVALGDLADLVLTDGRSRRDRPTGGLARHDATRSALGDDQRRWLLDTLTSSTAAWRLWGNPSVLSPTYHDGVPDDLVPALRKLKLLAPDELVCDPDQWDGYPSERAAILDHLRDAEVRDLVVLSGDIHVGLATEVHRDAVLPDHEGALAVELVTASITSQNLDDKLGYRYGGSAAVQERFLEAFPHARFADFDGHGYLLVDLTHERLQAQWWFVDDVLVRTDGEFCAAAYEVPRGTARLDEVALAATRHDPRPLVSA